MTNEDGATGLEEADAALWTRAMRHLRRSQRWQMWIKLLLILGGGSLAGLAQLPLGLPDTTNRVIGLIGVAMALLGGVLLLLIEKDHVDLMVEAREAVTKWRAAKRSCDQVEREKQDLTTALEAERLLAVAFDTIIRFLHTALSHEKMTLDERLDSFVSGAAARLVDPMKLGDEDWTISIFRKMEVKGQIRMCRAASCWKDRASENDEKRSWARGKGWTGKAWANGEDQPSAPYVVEADAWTKEAQLRYDMDGQGREEDRERYKSVVAIPLHVQGSKEVFGVVTATSGRIEAFGVQEGTPPRRNFDTIKSFTLLVAALAASQHTAP